MEYACSIRKKKEKERTPPVLFCHKALTKKQKVLAVKDCIHSFLYSMCTVIHFLKNILNERRL